MRSKLMIINFVFIGSGNIVTYGPVIYKSKIMFVFTAVCSNFNDMAIIIIIAISTRQLNLKIKNLQIWYPINQINKDDQLDL